MKKMITICAECKKELKMETDATIEQAHTSFVLNKEVVYSHSICHECGVKLYGLETMAKVVAKMKLPNAGSRVSEVSCAKSNRFLC